MLFEFGENLVENLQMVFVSGGMDDVVNYSQGVVNDAALPAPLTG